MLYVFFLVRSFDSFGGGLLFTALCKQTVHFRAQADKLDDGVAIALVFKFTDHFAVFGGVVIVTNWIVRGVKAILVPKHVGIRIVRVQLITQRICVGEEKFGFVFVRFKNIVIVKFVHE